ncbi:MAG: HPP family protein [Azoarcus sp.]|nr:HPP family protein [Azoarcus sp.]
MPDQQHVNGRERLRAGFGALLGILATVMLGRLFVDGDALLPWVIAPMGASAVLLFAVPASPLAQPWAMLGGNLLAAAIGVTCARGLPEPMMAAAVAVSAAIGLMFVLRCIHPPAGAVALTAVVGGPAIDSLGYGFVVYPVLVNSVCLLALAIVYNRATGREYPQRRAVIVAASPSGAEPAAARGLATEDLDAVLDEYNQVLDISREDLRDLFLRAEAHAYRRRFGTVCCAEVMTRGVIAVQFGTTLEEAWALMRQHQIKALPVVDRARRVVGILSRADFMRRADLDDHRGLSDRLRRFVVRSGRTHGDKAEVVGQIMSAPAQTATESTPVVDLIALLGGAGHSHIPIVDEDGRLSGIVTPRDLIAALYRGRLAAVA